MEMQSDFFELSLLDAQVAPSAFHDLARHSSI